jgi:hypothetical protein
MTHVPYAIAVLEITLFHTGLIAASASPDDGECDEQDGNK